MKKIPNKINDVTIEFSNLVNRNVTDEMHAALVASISDDIVDGHPLEKLFVSSASESTPRHRCPSRHKTGNGVDISRINGKKIGSHYLTDEVVKLIVDSLQTKFESAPARRENFGPTIQKKEGIDYPIAGHKDHFHWSVNGDHSECSSALRRLFEWLYLDRIFRDSNLESDESDETCSL